MTTGGGDNGEHRQSAQTLHGSPLTGAGSGYTGAGGSVAGWSVDTATGDLTVYPGIGTGFIIPKAVVDVITANGVPLASWVDACINSCYGGPMGPSWGAQQLSMQAASQQRLAQALGHGLGLGAMPWLAGGGGVQTSTTATWARIPQITSIPSLKLEVAAIKVGEIIGYRCWNVIDTGEGLRLVSTYTNCHWPPDAPMTAGYGGQHGDEKTPGDHDGLGVYAFKDKGTLWQQFPPVAGYHVVYGTVRLWGEIVEHEMGYRAQFARVASLDDISPGLYKQSAARRFWFGLPKSDLLDRLREIYLKPKG